MINNRQGGRRRGRGGQRPQGMAGNSGGNRQDNRQRGNAAQLLEKYKSMARDAQLSGDRVQSEYFLQFADHYFRVLGESRGRFDDQRRQRGDEDSDDDGEELAEAEAETGDSADAPPRRQQRSRGDTERPERRDRPNGGARDKAAEDAGERIDFDVLPPAIGDDRADASRPGDDTDEVDAPRPRRRARKPRADEGEGDDATLG